MSPQHPGDSNDQVDDDDLKASNKDDFEIQSLFPSTLHYLDLSVLELKEKVTDHLPLPLLLHKEYDYL